MMENLLSPLAPGFEHLPLHVWHPGLKGSPFSNILDFDSLVSGWKLQVDADAAVLAAVGSAGSRTSGHDVFVKSNIKDGSSGIDVDIGVARGTPRSDGSDIENLDLTGGRGRRRDDPSADRAGKKKTTEETHL